MKEKQLNIMLLTLVMALLWAGPAAGQTLGGITLTEVVPRVVTPNGDLLNDNFERSGSTSLRFRATTDQTLYADQNR